MQKLSLFIVCGLLMPKLLFAGEFYTDFERNFRYVVPYKHNTTKEAVERSDGVLTVTIEPGMFGASSDRSNGKERAELGISLSDRDVWVRQEFRVRAQSGFPTNSRVMISQIKFSDAPKGFGSPPIAVYMSQGGAVKCNDYSSGHPSQDHHRLRGVRLDDGNWHSVVMELVISDTAGLCRVVVDGRTMIEMKGIDTHQNGKDLVGRIGPYRDQLSVTQVVQFDDWKVQSYPKLAR
ncbi:heparin lyase I family protein [Pseudophaeobacter sp.]|uniref:heparin lyase I family protein n=1 Tax=Pseudophaeobacter sp. TaxID=1971739 RepID=UPI003299BC2C